jgi:hypothetical protein
MGKDCDSPSVSATIESLRTKVPPQILGHYDRMVARGKKGIALVRNGVCRECHVRLAIGAMQVLRHGSDIQLCGNCGRYLHLEEDVAAPAGPAVSHTASSPKPTPKVRTRKTKKAPVEHAL